MSDTKRKPVLQRYQVNRLWFIPLMQSAILILVGLWFITNPEAPLTFIILLMGTYWFIDGIANIIRSLKQRKTMKYWWWQLLIGLLSTAAGVMVFLNPEASTLLATTFLVYYIAAVAVVTGISNIISGIKIQKSGNKDRSLIIGGAISLFFGVIMFVYPMLPVYTVIYAIGGLALVSGVIFGLFAIRLRAKLYRM